MVLAVTGYVWQSGVGAVFGREAVLITSRRSRGPHVEPVGQHRSRWLTIRSASGRPGRLALHGYTVVELSTGIAGAYCTKLLADGGATGDQNRAATG